MVPLDTTRQPHHLFILSLPLALQLYYMPDTLQTYLGLTYDKKVDPAKHDGTKPDNIFKVFSEFLPPGKYYIRASGLLGMSKFSGPCCHDNTLPCDSSMVVVVFMKFKVVFNCFVGGGGGGEFLAQNCLIFFHV